MIRNSTFKVIEIKWCLHENRYPTLNNATGNNETILWLKYTTRRVKGGGAAPSLGSSLAFCLSGRNGCQLGLVNVICDFAGSATIGINSFEAENVRTQLDSSGNTGAADGSGEIIQDAGLFV